jgi:hypothetical protein
MADPIEAHYTPDGDDWAIAVKGRGRTLTGRAPGLIAARDRADQLVEELAPDDVGHRTVVHMLNGDAVEFTTAYLTARLARTEEPPAAEAAEPPDAEEAAAAPDDQAPEETPENDAATPGESASEPAAGPSATGTGRASHRAETEEEPSESAEQAAPAEDRLSASRPETHAAH